MDKLLDIVGRCRYPSHPNRSPINCMYHSISEKAGRDWGPWQYSVSPNEFEQQIEWISRNKTVVSIRDLSKYLSGKTTIPSNAVVITFDDGYIDFADKALPVLEKYGIPCIVYVSTELMENGKAPYEFRLVRALRQQDQITVTLDEREYQYSLTSEKGLREAYSELRFALKRKSTDSREQLIEQINDGGCSEFRIMAPDAVQRVGDHQLVTIGSHGHEHRPLGSLSKLDLEQNIQRSRKALSELLNTPPKHFSYPYGSHSRQVRSIVKKVGFKSAVTTNQRPIQPRDFLSKYQLPRIDMSQLSTVHCLSVN